MQLKDKQTAEIKTVRGGHILVHFEDGTTRTFKTIAELNENLEEVSELKPFVEVAKPKFELGIGTSSDEAMINTTIKIADQDYYEILPDGTKKTEFTWDEAMGIEKKTGGKWRVPTEQEWFLIAGAFGEDKETGRITGKALAENLGLAHNKEDYGHYWSSTPYAATGAHSLVFNSTDVSPQAGGNKTSGLTVRCVAR